MKFFILEYKENKFAKSRYNEIFVKLNNNEKKVGVICADC